MNCIAVPIQSQVSQNTDFGQNFNLCHGMREINFQIVHITASFRFRSLLSLCGRILFSLNYQIEVNKLPEYQFYLLRQQATVKITI